MLNDIQVRDLILRLFHQESDRDKQRSIGASQISDPCDYHLANALLGHSQGEIKYWLGAKIGSAVHLYMESLMESADPELFPELIGAKVEEKIRLGELEGYGEINSRPDLALVRDSHLIDWKTSSRDKSRKLQKYLDGASNDSGSDYTLKKYVAQTQLYAWGLNNAGINIDGISLAFINREGTTAADIWTYTFEYSEEFALAMWSRLETIWAIVRENDDLEGFERNPDCFPCSFGVKDTPTELILK